MCSRANVTGPQKISFKIGGDRFDKILDWPHLAVARIEGGSEAWEIGVALRVGAVFNKARFLGRRLTKWISRLSTLCLAIAPWSPADPVHANQPATAHPEVLGTAQQ
jgi:hypothetical protein